jgi:heat shock protein HtpX
MTLLTGTIRPTVIGSSNKTHMTTYQYQNKNVRSTILIFVLFTTLTSSIGLALSYMTNNSLFLVGAAGMAVAQGLFGYFAGEGLALSSANAQKIDESSQPMLYNLVDDISRIAGIPRPDIYISPDPSANAFACGRGPGRASVCVNQGLIDMLSKEELEGVLAHEISHIKNRDTLTMTMAMVMSSVIAFAADIGMRANMMSGNDDEGGNNNPFVFFVMIISFLAAPFLSTILTMAVSRSREYLADASAVAITRYPQGLINALEKISSNPVATTNYSTATAHMYISEPKREYGEAVKDSWFSTHPAMENRIRALMDQDGKLESLK